jgi:uncharacterized membrane-anchored protein
MFHDHPHRDTVLAEVHARPAHRTTSGRRHLHWAFLTDAEQSAVDRRRLEGLCRRRGATPPAASDKQHSVAFSAGLLRWEQHGEFTTYTWETVWGEGAAAASPPEFEQPGPHLVSVDLRFVAATGAEALTPLLDGRPIAKAEAARGAAIVATDFHADERGYVQYAVLDQGLSPEAAGGLIRNLLDLETYRLLALLGLPEAQRALPAVARGEETLRRLTVEMVKSEGLESNHALLVELIQLAADLEAEAASSQFRFSASRAYYDIVLARLASLQEEACDGHQTLTGFLGRRLAPALGSCRSVEARQSDLSAKLARAAQLLRTRVEVELQRQNTIILADLNDRTSIQLRLQQAVEGLSVVGVAYYLVGLAGYLLKGLHEMGAPIDYTLATGLGAPVALVAVAVYLKFGRAGPAAA